MFFEGSTPLALVTITLGAIRACSAFNRAGVCLCGGIGRGGASGMGAAYSAPVIGAGFVGLVWRKWVQAKMGAG